MADPSRIVVAECPACGERRFRAAGATVSPDDVLTCESCGLKLSYAFLQSRMPPPAAEPEPLPGALGKRGKKRKTAKRRKRP